MPDKPEAESFPISRLPAGEKSPKDSCEVNFSSVTNTRGYQTLPRRREPAPQSIIRLGTLICHKSSVPWRWPFVPLFARSSVRSWNLGACTFQSPERLPPWVGLYHALLIASMPCQLFIEIAPPSRSLRVSAHASGQRCDYLSFYRRLDP